MISFDTPRLSIRGFDSFNQIPRPHGMVIGPLKLNSILQVYIVLNDCEGLLNG